MNNVVHAISRSGLIASLLLVCFSQLSNAQWDIAYYNDTCGFRTVFFVNDSTGFAGSVCFAPDSSGSGYIWKTTDYGDTWYPVFHTAASIDVIYFPSESVGYATGLQMPVYKTADGGETWFNPNADQEMVFVMHDLEFLDESRGIGVFAGGGAFNYNTYDGGITWTQDETTGGWGIDFSSDCVGHISVGSFYRQTGDCGESWNIWDVNELNQSAHNVDFVNDSIGFMCGQTDSDEPYYNQGFIEKTIDGGETWTSETFIGSHHYAAISFPSDSIGYACGYAPYSGYPLAFLKTTDQGMTWGYQDWQPLFIDGDQYYPNITDVFCVNDTMCFATNMLRAIYRTTNGGGEVNPIAVSVNEIVNRKIILYPNPTSTSITVLFNEKLKEDCFVHIYNSAGQQTKTISLRAGIDKVAIDVNDLRSGVYQVVLNTNTFADSCSFVIE
ncbi:MAG: T9SS type A sorting domain-containing protein [Flavobacteriales bacterium]|nr:T9SS type A sorting domain-containing protein [Flavobacteriales bacterium]